MNNNSRIQQQQKTPLALSAWVSLVDISQIRQPSYTGPTLYHYNRSHYVMWQRRSTTTTTTKKPHSPSQNSCRAARGARASFGLPLCLCRLTCFFVFRDDGTNEKRITAQCALWLCAWLELKRVCWGGWYVCHWRWWGAIVSVLSSSFFCWREKTYIRTKPALCMDDTLELALGLSIETSETNTHTHTRAERHITYGVRDSCLFFFCDNWGIME